MIIQTSIGTLLTLAAVLAPGVASTEPPSTEILDQIWEIAPEIAELAAPASAEFTEFNGAVAIVDGDAIQIASGEETIGLISEPAADGASIESILMEDASALFAIRIERPTAPVSYDFTFDIPEGSETTILEDGGIIIRDANGNYAGGVAPPWARDANGNDVSTWFTVSGKQLTQHVAIDEVAEENFPVIADPYLGKWLVESAYVTSQSGSNYVVRAVPTAYGRHASGAAILAEHTADLKSRLGTLASKVTPTIENQFHCHVVGNELGGGDTYDMESWRPNVWWWVQAAVGCNP